MVLFVLLLVPLGLGLAGLLLGQGRVTWKEFLVHEGVMLLLIAASYFIALHYKSSDTEVWNGTVRSKDKIRVDCCHSYSCDCREVCTGSGKDRSCRTECDTCYRHGPRKSGWNGDVAWNAYSSNGERVYYDGCNAPSSSAPRRWTEIRIGEPTAVEHRYDNYIKGNPDSILRRQGAAERFKGRLPSYPEVYDHYRIRRFIAIGVPVEGLDALDERLSEINGRLGALKKVNVVVIVVKEGDQRYLEALRETWLGGKINDFVVVVGVPEPPDIAWAGVISWTRNEDLKVQVRDEIVALGTFDGTRVLDIVEANVESRFEHRPISDFEYLKSTIEPSGAVTWTIGILGALIALGLQIWFWFRDPFGDGHAPYRRARRFP